MEARDIRGLRDFLESHFGPSIRANDAGKFDVAVTGALGVTEQGLELRTSSDLVQSPGSPIRLGVPALAKTSHTATTAATTASHAMATAVAAIPIGTPPAAHAMSHTFGGSDAVAIEQVQVHDLTSDLANIQNLISASSGLTRDVAVLVAGSVVVPNTDVTALSIILLTPQNASGTVGSVRISARTPSVSFTITSSSVLDTSTVAWVMLEP